MVKFDFSVVVSIYLFITVVGLLSIWTILDWRTKIERHTIDKKNILECPICTYVYINIKNDKLSICPRCRSYNEKNSYINKSKGGDE